MNIFNDHTFKIVVPNIQLIYLWKLFSSRYQYSVKTVFFSSIHELQTKHGVNSTNIQFTSDRDWYLHQIMNEWLRKIMNRLKWDMNTFGCQISGLDVKYSLSKAKFLGSSPVGAGLWMCTAEKFHTGTKRLFSIFWFSLNRFMNIQLGKCCYFLIYNLVQWFKCHTFAEN